MKTVYVRSLLLLITVCLAACKKDFLQLDLGTALPEEKVFSDPLLASRFADNAYNYMLDDFGRLADTYKGMTGQFSDEATSSASTGAITVMWQGNFLNPGASDVTGVYTRMYQGIRTVNTALSKLEIVPWTSEYNPRLIKAQLLFLRGMYYFELVKRYGGVILLSAPLSPTDNTDLPRSTYNETVAFILKDLKESEEILASESTPELYSPTTDWNKSDGTISGNYGRITIGAVKALKARLLLLDASPLHNTANDLSKWKTAANASKDIISMGKYSLHPDYNTLLNQNFSPEYILIKVKQPRSLSGMLADYIMSPGSGGAQGTLNPTHNHVDLYEAVKKNSGGQIISSAPINTAGSGYNLQNPYNDRDPRFYANIIYHDQNWQGRKIQMFENGNDFKSAAVTFTRTRYYCKKLWPEIYRAGATAQTLINFIYFRYGEVLLNYAEALNEAEGPVADVYTSINQVRARAGMPGLPAGLSKDAMRTRIHNERGVELAFEEIRWWDILRWKKGAELVSQPITAMDVVRTGSTFTYSVVPLAESYQRAPFRDNMYLYPIPLSEILKSKSILVQNPGW